MIENKLNSSNKGVAIDFILKCYTEYFSEPKAFEGAGKLHLDRMKEFTETFSDDSDKKYLVEEGLSIHANGNYERTNCMDETWELRKQKRQDYLAGTRTKLEDVVLVDIPKMFTGEVKEDEDEEDDFSSTPKKLNVPKKPKSHLKAKMSILSDKIVSTPMSDDMKFMKTLYDVINMQEDTLLNQMKDKLEYLGIESLEVELDTSVPKDLLFEDICGAFLDVEFSKEEAISDLLNAMEFYLK